MVSHVVRRAALCFCSLVAAAALLGAADILTQLGLNAAAAKESVISAVGSASVDLGLFRPAFKAASGAARAELVKGVIAYMKAYTATEEFKAAYAKMRELQKPSAPEFTGTPEEEFAANLAKQNKDMAEGLASLPAEVRKEMEAAMKEAAKAMATPEGRKMQVDGIRMEREEKTAAYNERLKRWTEDYPADSRAIVARRLQAFLDTSADVDFAAKLEKRGGLMRFVNEAYEDKPAEWKLCYRAGNEAVTAARAAVQAWLKELGRP